MGVRPASTRTAISRTNTTDRHVAAEVHADGNLDALLVGAADGGEELAALVSGVVVLLVLGTELVAFRVVVADVDGRHQEGTLRRHHLDAFVVDECPMLDGTDAGGDGLFDTVSGVGVRGDRDAVAVRLGDGGFEFLRAERDIARIVADRW